LSHSGTCFAPWLARKKERVGFCSYRSLAHSHLFALINNGDVSCDVMYRLHQCRLLIRSWLERRDLAHVVGAKSVGSDGVHEMEFLGDKQSSGWVDGSQELRVLAR
jgi:hypothetical protein